MSKKFFSKLNGLFCKDEDGRKAENIKLNDASTYVALPGDVQAALIQLANRFATVDAALDAKADKGETKTGISNLEIKLYEKAEKIHGHSLYEIAINPPLLYNGTTYTSLYDFIMAIANNNQ